MDKAITPVVITAIADSDFEGFVASTLFSQGWSVSFRALDASSLTKYITSHESKEAILIFSPDLPGISQEILNALKPLLHRLIGFTSASESTGNLFDVTVRPNGPLELIEAIRGNMRAPMLRTPQTESSGKKRATVIAFGSLGHATGCTTVAINYAFEVAHIGKKVLLIDGNHRSPAVSVLLDQRNLSEADPWKQINENIFGLEVTHQNIEVVSANLVKATQTFDCIIFDLGSINDLANILVDRRWASQLSIWCCNNADELIIVTNPGLLPQQRLRRFISTLSKITIAAKIGYVYSGKERNRKGENEEEQFLATITPLHPSLIYILPSDLRGIVQAQNEQKPLGEVNERGPLRKAIAQMAREMTA